MSANPARIPVNEPNRWRLETPGHEGWARTAHATAEREKKYYMVSTDCHANEPADLWVKRIEPRYRDRLPRVVTDAEGVQWRVSEGYRPDRLRISEFEGEDQARAEAGAGAASRLADHERDGIDA